MREVAAGVDDADHHARAAARLRAARQKVGAHAHAGDGGLELRTERARSLQAEHAGRKPHGGDVLHVDARGDDEVAVARPAEHAAVLNMGDAVPLAHVAHARRDRVFLSRLQGLRALQHRSIPDPTAARISNSRLSLIAMRLPWRIVATHPSSGQSHNCARGRHGRRLACSLRAKGRTTPEEAGLPVRALVLGQPSKIVEVAGDGSG